MAKEDLGDIDPAVLGGDVERGRRGWRMAIGIRAQCEQKVYRGWILVPGRIIEWRTICADVIDIRTVRNQVTHESEVAVEHSRDKRGIVTLIHLVDPGVPADEQVDD